MDIMDTNTRSTRACGAAAACGSAVRSAASDAAIGSAVRNAASDAAIGSAVRNAASDAAIGTSFGKVALVTGGTSGIGLETAAALLARGFKVYTLSRRSSDDRRFSHLRADITVFEELKEAVDTLIEKEGRLDLVVNNAGFGISGAIEFTLLEDAQKQFDVTFFGMVRLNSLIIPIMRGQSFGRIVNISSVAAPIPIPFQAYYSAAKAAVNSYTMALANELRPYGVSVCAVQPGDIKTGFTAAREKSYAGDDIYGGRISRSVEKMEKDEQGGSTPEAAGRFIASVACKRTVAPIYTIGAQYKLFCFLVRIMPSGLLNRLVYGLYAK